MHETSLRSIGAYHVKNGLEHQQTEQTADDQEHNPVGTFRWRDSKFLALRGKRIALRVLYALADTPCRYIRGFFHSIGSGWSCSSRALAFCTREAWHDLSDVVPTTPSELQ